LEILIPETVSYWSKLQALVVCVFISADPPVSSATFISGLVKPSSQAGGAFIGGLGLSYNQFILAFIGMFFILGMFFDAFILMLACLPPLLGALTAYEVPPIQFGVLFTLVVILGQITPR
jgi:TRAP-type mannitol/chloroaromatic compound transport system permease large subunit